MNETIPAATAAITFRPLKRNEIVKRSDFVEDGNQGFEPWSGPVGFQASSFHKQIYRKYLRRSVEETPVA